MRYHLSSANVDAQSVINWPFVSQLNDNTSDSQPLVNRNNRTALLRLAGLLSTADAY